MKTEVLITKEQLQTKVTEIAKAISKDYKDINGITLIGLLRGSVIFLSDLIREIDIPNIEMDFLTVSSYGNNTVSSKNVKIIKDLDENIDGKHIIIIEDIIDTGFTLERVLDILHSRNPKSIKTCCLLNKPSRREVDIKVDYIGYDIEDVFVVGYGIDYAQKYRNLPYIAKVIKD